MAKADSEEHVGSEAEEKSRLEILCRGFEHLPQRVHVGIWYIFRRPKGVPIYLYCNAQVYTFVFLLPLRELYDFGGLCM